VRVHRDAERREPRQGARQGLGLRPSLVLAVFAIGRPPEYPGLHAFVNAVERANVPGTTDIYAGTYGPNRATADAIRALRATADAVARLPSGIYAPMFSIQPKSSTGPYAGRHLPKADLDRLDPRYGGAIPLHTPGKPLPRGDYLLWGRELGCRFRDTLRHAGRNNEAIATTWQFDEVVAEVVSGQLAVPYRLYVAGVLQGLHFGREALGDPRQRGMVWAAEATLAPLPRLRTPTGSPLAFLWDAIDNASRLYVGEEYVAFDGDPVRAAERSSVGQRRLLAAGPIRRKIGHKYVVGMTPGFIRSSQLGGNVHGWPLARVNEWRDGFVRARARLAPVAGFGQFNFTGENARADVARTAIQSAAFPFPT